MIMDVFFVTIYSRKCSFCNDLFKNMKKKKIIICNKKIKTCLVKKCIDYMCNIAKVHIGTSSLSLCTYRIACYVIKAPRQ